MLGIVLPLSAILPSPAVAATPPAVDRQLWSELDLTHEFGSAFAATAIVTTRLGDSLPNPTLAAGGLELDYRAGAWIASATGYGVEVRNPESGARRDLWLAAAAVTAQHAWGPLTLSDRNRIEQLEGLPGAPVRYRNRGAFDWRLPGDGPPTDLLLSDEIFYDISAAHGWRNRASAGVALHMRPSTALQVSYLRQDDSTGAPRTLNVLVLVLQLAIT